MFYNPVKFNLPKLKKYYFDFKQNKSKECENEDRRIGEEEVSHTFMK